MSSEICVKRPPVLKDHYWSASEGFICDQAGSNLIMPYCFGGPNQRCLFCFVAYVMSQHVVYARNNLVMSAIFGHAWLWLVMARLAGTCPSITVEKSMATKTATVSLDHTQYQDLPPASIW